MRIKRSLLRISTDRMREISWHCVGKRINWRNLFLVGAVMTVYGVFLQSLTLPFPLNMHLLSERKSILAYTIESSERLRVENLELHRTTPVLVLNSSTAISNGTLDVDLQNTRTRQKSEPSRRRRRRSKKNDDPIVVLPPPLRLLPHRLKRHIWSLPPREALLYAKREIQNASIITEDPYLYAPVFKNLSLFQRSYEMMEMILKVYIYPDGKRPLFHAPLLTGIYASEGWFLKLMEGNRQFVTKDPEKAHLFYLPYSSRQLAWALYVRESHDMSPISMFLRDYANMLAAKYPFWNRTHGSDHFLVACHDWGPYTLTMHDELTFNVIKAVCNADSSEGIFKPDHDVSLPETAIKNSGRPLRHIGRGNRVSQRPILAFFAGNMHGRVRPILLKYWHNKDEDMKIYGPLPIRISRKMTYIQHMKSSKYCICPMGHEVNSPRIIEAIYYECVPVIIADNFGLPLGDVLDWSQFSVVVAEKDIPKLKEILLTIPLRRYLKMQINVKMVQKHFYWNQKPVRFDLFHMILHSIWFKRLEQIHMPEP
ncbi:hypothetical protein ACFE04_012367 [Oxalis oulophora]